MTSFPGLNLNLNLPPRPFHFSTVNCCGKYKIRARNGGHGRDFQGGIQDEKASKTKHKDVKMNKELEEKKKRMKNARTEAKTTSVILRMEAAAAAIERKAKAATKGTPNRKLFPKTVLQALNSRILDRQCDSALLIFELMREQEWYEPKTEIYLKLLDILGRCGKSEDAHRLFQMMLKEGCKANAESYTALLAAYGRNDLFDEAFSVLEKMKSIPNCQPNIYTYNILIKSSIMFGHYNYVGKLITEMLTHGITPNIVTYNTLIEGYAKADMLREMENIVVHIFRKQECRPDEYTMNSVLKAFGYKGQIKAMEHWYQEFYNLGILPTERTFNIMLSSYGKSGLYQKLASIIDNMQNSYYSWTTVTYNIIIDAYGKGGDIHEMEKYYTIMVSEGIKPTAVTFCCLVTAYGKVGDTYNVSKVIRLLENSDIVPDTAFFNSVITAYHKAGNYEEMEKILQLMKMYNCKPNDRTLDIMSKAYSNADVSRRINELRDDAKTFSR